LVRYWECP